MEEFHTFLQSKKIDPEKFKKGNPDRYLEFERLFQSMHPNSLVSQKLFLINQIRRSYPFVEKQEVAEATKKVKMKPRIIPKAK